MRVRILNHNAYGPILSIPEKEMYGVGTVHEVLIFYPDTGEVDVGDIHEEITFDSSEYEVVGERPDWVK